MLKKLSLQIKFLLFAVLFSSLIAPSLALPCQAKRKAESSRHECCLKKDLCAAKISQPPCCESCRHSVPHEATVTSSAPVSSEAPSVTFAVLNPGDFGFSSNQNLDILSATHPPPLYLSLKTFLC